MSFFHGKNENPNSANMCIHLSTCSIPQCTFDNCTVNPWLTLLLSMTLNLLSLRTFPWILSHLDKRSSADTYQRPPLFRFFFFLSAYSQERNCLFWGAVSSLKLLGPWDFSIHKRIAYFLALEMHKNLRILEKPTTIKTDSQTKEICGLSNLTGTHTTGEKYLL